VFNEKRDMVWFSIVITTFNRKEAVIRAINSCVEQKFKDFEVVVVDDCSMDSTVEFITKLNHKKIRVISHVNNLGNSASRHTGSLNANGKWIINLDSDHTLKKGALEFLYEKTKLILEDIGIIGARYEFDDGRLSPSFVPDCKIDYIGRIKWVEKEGGKDYLCCYKKSLYECIQWPISHKIGDAIFQLNLAKITNALIYQDVIAEQYTEDVNSLSRYQGLSGIRAMISQAPHRLWQDDEIILYHGDMLKIYGMNTYNNIVLNQALHSFLVSKRMRGLFLSGKYLKSKPYSIKMWAILVFGMFNRYILSAVYIFYKRF